MGRLTYIDVARLTSLVSISTLLSSIGRVITLEPIFYIVDASKVLEEYIRETILIALRKLIKNQMRASND